LVESRTANSNCGLIFTIGVGLQPFSPEIFQSSGINGMRNDITMGKGQWRCGAKEKGCGNSAERTDGMFHIGSFGKCG